MQGIRNTITDPALRPDDGLVSSKAKGVNKWDSRLQATVTKLANEVEDGHLFDVYVEGDLVLQTDFPADCHKVIVAARQRGEQAAVAYVGPERRDLDARP